MELGNRQAKGKSRDPFMKADASQQKIQSLPHNPEMEQMVLGALLVDNGVISQVLEILKQPEDFHATNHQLLFKCCIEMVSQKIPFDVFTCHDYLERKGYLSEDLNSSYLTYLTRLVPSTANVLYYANQVKEKAQETRLCKQLVKLDQALRNKSVSYIQACEEITTFLRKHETLASSQFKFLSWPDLIGKEEPRIEFLIEDLLPAGNLIILAGKPKLGKSLLALLWALSIGLGKSLWNRKVNQGPVLFISTEDGEIRLKKRIWKMIGNPDAHQPDFYFYIGNCILTDKGIFDALRTKVIEFQPRLIVLDPLINLFKGRELNSGEDMNLVLRPLQNLAKETGATVLVIHHARKSAGEDPIDVVQGSITISGVADGILILKNLRRELEEKRATLEIILKDAEVSKTTVLKLDERLRWNVEGELEEVTSRNVDTEIIKALNDEKDGLTIAQLQQITEYEYKPLYRCLRKLEDQNRIRYEKHGRSHIKVYFIESEGKTKMENEKADITNGNSSEKSDTETSFSTTTKSGKRNEQEENEEFDISPPGYLET